MATKKISDLTAITTVSGAAVIPVVQDGATVKVTFANLTGSIAGLTAVPPTASHALTALTASYAVSASYEIAYELSSSYAETATTASYAQTATSSSYAETATSSSYAETATSASHALVSNTATSASFATTATTASRLYKDVAPIYVGTQQKDSLAATEMTGEVITIKSNDDTTSTPAYVVSNTNGTKLGSFAMQPVNGEVYLSVFNGGLNLLSSTGIIKASGSLDVRDSLIVRNGASGSFSGSFVGDGSGLTGISATVFPYNGDAAITGSLTLENTLGNGSYTIGVINNGDAQMGTGTNLNMVMKADGTNVLYNGVYVSASLQIDPSAVLTLTPAHPLPFAAATGSFAVSGSTPPKPYFWDGSTWNALY